MKNLFSFKESEIKEGETIPDVELLNSKGIKVLLSSYPNWKVIYFYPKDNTPGCTIEAQTFSSYSDEFADKGVKIFGINQDSIESHNKFSEKNKLNFELLTDPKGQLAKLLGVKILFGLCSRDTFLLNEQNKLIKVYRNFSPKNGPTRLLDDLELLKKS